MSVRFSLVAEQIKHIFMGTRKLRFYVIMPLPLLTQFGHTDCSGERHSIKAKTTFFKQKNDTTD